MKVNVRQNTKILVLVLSIIFSLQKSNAQQDDFWSNVSFGGNLGIGIGNDTFSGVIEPAAIYNFNEQFSLGAGISFGYLESNDYTATNYGGRILAFYNPLREIQLSMEFQEMGVSRTFEIASAEDLKENYWYPALFFGAGYRIGNVNVGVRYDVLYDEDKSIYGSAYVPFIGVFF
ncbi:alpha-ketoglutarate decarboxylase [Aquimarina sediminis]|uniref:alpha-ketoglutarate decarboxylase n=1 Tax=Aquimarina sediminis TaxID=2070536 RepID=UPI001F4EF92F|nr:alpha-ketoglutarate decarboxylase [Aquimarina sediminis]